MTTLITKVNDNAYTLTAGSYNVEVYCGSCLLNVYAGKERLGAGRTFHQPTTAERLAAAAKSYKAAEIRSALEALSNYLAA